METTNTNETITLDQINDILESFAITRINRRNHGGGGTWVTGTMGGHKFQALVFPEHAENESYELDNSKISKLCLRRLSDKQIVACFDRGWDRRPTTKVAEITVESLCEGLAKAVFE